MEFFYALAIFAVVIVISVVISIVLTQKSKKSPTYQANLGWTKAMPTFEKFRQFVKRAYIIDAVLTGILFLQALTYTFLPILLGQEASIFDYLYMMAKTLLSIKEEAKTLFVWRLGFFSGILAIEIGASLAYLIFLVVRLGKGITEEQVYRRFAGRNVENPKRNPLSIPIMFCAIELLLLFVPFMPFDGQSSVYNGLYSIPIILGLAVFICGIVFCVLETRVAKSFYAESGFGAANPPAANPPAA